MIKFIFKNNKSFFIFFVVILMFYSFNNIFLNTFIIFKNNFDTRMIKKYGYCNNQGYGFIKSIYKKYKFDEEILIINYNRDIPSSNWILNQFHQIKDSKYAILLNYNGNRDDKKIIDFYKNCYLIKLK